MACIGTLLGFPFLKAIKKKTNNEEQLRIAHLAGILGGVFMIAFGAVWNKLEVGPTEELIAGYGTIVSNWLFLMGMIVSGYSGERGLSSKTKSFAGKTVFVTYILAALFSTVGTIGLLGIIML